MTRWLGLFLVCGVLTAAFGFTGVVRGAWDGIWIALLFSILLFAFSRVWLPSRDRTVSR